MRRTVFVALAALALALATGPLAAAGPAAASARPPAVSSPAVSSPAVSSNVAGYAATGTTGEFSSVSSNWTEPQAHCSTGNQYASFFVGLDGFSDATIEQIGTNADCVGATPEYYAWYEVYPAGPVIISHPVAAGDAISASVTYNSGHDFTLKISDATKGWSGTFTKASSGALRTSAEVLVERPCCTAAMTDFGSVSFTGAMVNQLGLCDSHPMQETMSGVTVSPIKNCKDFTVTQT